MTYSDLRADCLYTGISSGPNARYRVREALTFLLLATWDFMTVNMNMIRDNSVIKLFILLAYSTPP